jgi:hypothetical protein
MKRRTGTLLILTALASATPLAPVYAQESDENVLVLRRVVSPPSPQTSGNNPVQQGQGSGSQQDVGDPNGSGSDHGNDDGPEENFSWIITSYGPWNEQCAETTRSVNAHCIDGSGQQVDDSFCDNAGPRPSVDTGVNEDGCEVLWTYSEWLEWSSQCATNDSRRREANCVRETPGTSFIPLQDSHCSELPQENLVETDSTAFGCLGYLRNHNFEANFSDWSVDRDLTITTNSADGNLAAEFGDGGTYGAGMGGVLRQRLNDTAFTGKVYTITFR